VKKIRNVRALLDRAGNTAPIEVDGGIDLSTVTSVVEAGAEWLVAGHAIFGGGNAEKAAAAIKDTAIAAARGK
jgi:ribulose-phosphate 3-epimerase